MCKKLIRTFVLCVIVLFKGSDGYCVDTPYRDALIEEVRAGFRHFKCDWEKWTQHSTKETKVLISQERTESYTSLEVVRTGYGRFENYPIYGTKTYQRTIPATYRTDTSYPISYYWVCRNCKQSTLDDPYGSHGQIPSTFHGKIDLHGIGDDGSGRPCSYPITRFNRWEVSNEIDKYPSAASTSDELYLVMIWTRASSPNLLRKELTEKEDIDTWQKLWSCLWYAAEELDKRIQQVGRPLVGAEKIHPRNWDEYDRMQEQLREQWKKKNKSSCPCTML
jgi:hypothetical protein